MTDLPSIPANISSVEVLLVPCDVPIATTVDIPSIHLVSIPSLVLLNGDKRRKHRNGKLF